MRKVNDNRLEKRVFQAKMDNPKLYLEANSSQNKLTKEILEEYGKYIKWSKNPEVLDIGCATGDVTHDILLPAIPALKRLLAVDINPKMIATASKKYKNHPNIQFDTLDIEKPIPETLKNNFDNVFSFICLHWIKDQK